MTAQFNGFDPNCLYSSPEGVQIGVKNAQRRLKIFFEDDNVAYDPDTLRVQVEDFVKDSMIIEGSLAGGLVQKEADGIFYIDTEGTLPSEYDLVATTPKDYALQWFYTDPGGTGEEFLAVSWFSVINKYALQWFPRLRNEIDKAYKTVGCGRVGYLDSNLYYYLIGGIQEINKYPPVTNFTLQNWPREYGQLLVDSAAIVALTSQALFSIDTDTMSFSDQGFSFTTDHFSRIQSLLNSLSAKVEKELQKLKQEFTQIGSVQVQLVPYYPLGVMLKTSPRGNLFRNIFVSG